MALNTIASFGMITITNRSFSNTDYYSDYLTQVQQSSVKLVTIQISTENFPLATPDCLISPSSNFNSTLKPPTPTISNSFPTFAPATFSTITQINFAFVADVVVIKNKLVILT